MARKKFYVPKPKKCPKTRKTMFRRQEQASYAMMRTWAHDSKMDIYDYHTYQCPYCNAWHFGNKKVYEKYEKARPTDTTNSATVAGD